MLRICPRCNRRYVISEITGETDIIHDCDSKSKVRDEEDVMKNGNWEDYTGSGEVNNANLQGVENELFGTRAETEGENEEEQTRRGNRASNHRQRNHLEFIKLKDGN